MSETVHYIGTATKVLPDQGRTINDKARELCEEHKLTDRIGDIGQYDEPHHEGREWMYALAEWFPWSEKDDNGNEVSYEVVNGTLYYIVKRNYEYDDVILARREQSGEISFNLRYYNGGAGFGECLEEAINKMNNE